VRRVLDMRHLHLAFDSRVVLAVASLAVDLLLMLSLLVSTSAPSLRFLPFHRFKCCGRRSLALVVVLVLAIWMRQALDCA
jgi:hypothetical protein